MTPTLLSLGANLNPTPERFAEALDRLGELGRITAVSGLYETAPMYVEDQPVFINLAAILEANTGPLGLISAIKRIEQEIGRTPRERNHPREIDIDIVAYGSLRLHSEASRMLILPHPRTPERRFVLEPTFEIAPNWNLPGQGDIKSLLQAPEVQAQHVIRIGDAPISL